MRLSVALTTLGVSHNLPSVREHNTGGSLLELHRFDAKTGVETLAAHVFEQTEGHHPKAAAAIFKCIATTCENVGDHSKRRHGYVLAQKTYDQTKLHFAVADAGQGFRASLRTRGAASSAEALDMATRAGVSGLSDQARGYGLHEMIANLKAVKGNLSLHSGKASRTEYYTGYVDRLESKVAIQGSILEGMIPLRG